MDGLSQRIKLLYEGNVIDESGCRDLERLVALLVEKCGVDRDDERLVPIVTHLAAAIGRCAEGETVPSLGSEELSEVCGSDLYPKIEEICSELASLMENSLSPEERNYLLVHIGGLLTALQADERGEDL